MYHKLFNQVPTYGQLKYSQFSISANNIAENIAVSRQAEWREMLAFLDAILTSEPGDGACLPPGGGPHVL